VACRTIKYVSKNILIWVWPCLKATRASSPVRIMFQRVGWVIYHHSHCVGIQSSSTAVTVGCSVPLAFFLVLRVFSAIMWLRMGKFLKRSKRSTSRNEQNQSKNTKKWKILKYGLTVIDDKPQRIVCWKLPAIPRNGLATSLGVATHRLGNTGLKESSYGLNVLLRAHMF
jgi:hypothetical protein